MPVARIRFSHLQQQNTAVPGHIDRPGLVPACRNHNPRQLPVFPLERVYILQHRTEGSYFFFFNRPCPVLAFRNNMQNFPFSPNLQEQIYLMACA